MRIFTAVKRYSNIKLLSFHTTLLSSVETVKAKQYYLKEKIYTYVLSIIVFFNNLKS